MEKLVKAGKTILIVEQKIEKISAYCDKILLMHEGRIVDFDTPQKIFSRDDLEKSEYRRQALPESARR